MKIKIRRGCFESNSSSQHVLQIMMKDDYDQWRSSDNLYYYNGDSDFQWRETDIKPQKGCIYSKSQVIDFIKNSAFYSEDEIREYDEDNRDYYYYENGFISANYYFEMSEIGDEFEERFVTPKGEVIVAFGGIEYC